MVVKWSLTFGMKHPTPTLDFYQERIKYPFSSCRKLVFFLLIEREKTKKSLILPNRKEG
jgi:hypothetical protein